MALCWHIEPDIVSNCPADTQYSTSKMAGMGAHVTGYLLAYGLMLELSIRLNSPLSPLLGSPTLATHASGLRILPGDRMLSQPGN